MFQHDGIGPRRAIFQRLRGLAEPLKRTHAQDNVSPFILEFREEVDTRLAELAAYFASTR